MIIAVCGEDIVSSRKYFQEKIHTYHTNGTETRVISASEIAELDLWMAQAPGLFYQKSVYVTEHLNKRIRRSDKAFLEMLKKLHAATDVEVIAWEGISARNLKYAKFGLVKEFKPSASIFNLLDMVFPGNVKTFIPHFHELSQLNEPQFIFTMLCRQVRYLIMVKAGLTVPGLQSWQLGRYKRQAALWKLENLISFYEGFLRIDMGLKTGKNAFNLVESLDILASHYL